MRRRSVPKYGSLTSLLDVLFILMFASLAQAAALVKKAQTQQQPASTPSQSASMLNDAGVSAKTVVDSSVAPDAANDSEATTRAKLHNQAIDKLTKTLKRRRPIYAHVSAFGSLDVLAYEQGGASKRLQLSIPLVHKSPDVDVEWVYRNDGMCAIVRKALKLDNLANELIIVVMNRSTDPSAQNLALIRGLELEASRCQYKGLVYFELPKPTATAPAKGQP